MASFPGNPEEGSSKIDVGLLEKRLEGLRDTQESVQGLSIWCQANKKHSTGIIDTWLKVLRKSPVEKRLTMFYLANDIVQHAKRKGDATVVNQWAVAIQKATPFVRSPSSVSTAIVRIFRIWEERSVYSKETVADLISLITKHNVTTRDKLLEPKKKPEIYTAPDDKVKSFLPSALISKIKQAFRLKSHLGVTFRTKHYVNMNMNELIASIKDRQHGVSVIDEINALLDSCRTSTTKLQTEVEERRKIVEAAEIAIVYYENIHQEARIVNNAYRGFTDSVLTTKHRVDSLMRQFNDMEGSPSPPTPPPLYSLPMSGKFSYKDLVLDRAALDIIKQPPPPSKPPPPSPPPLPTAPAPEYNQPPPLPNSAYSTGSVAHYNQLDPSATAAAAGSTSGYDLLSMSSWSPMMTMQYQQLFQQQYGGYQAQAATAAMMGVNPTVPAAVAPNPPPPIPPQDPYDPNISLAESTSSYNPEDFAGNHSTYDFGSESEASFVQSSTPTLESHSSKYNNNRYHPYNNTSTNATPSSRSRRISESLSNSIPSLVSPSSGSIGTGSSLFPSTETLGQGLANGSNNQHQQQQYNVNHNNIIQSYESQHSTPKSTSNITNNLLRLAQQSLSSPTSSSPFGSQQSGTNSSGTNNGGDDLDDYESFYEKYEKSGMLHQQNSNRGGGGSRMHGHGASGNANLYPLGGGQNSFNKGPRTPFRGSTGFQHQSNRGGGGFRGRGGRGINSGTGRGGSGPRFVL